MNRRKLLQAIDADKVKAAIVAAEKETSGEIRVSVSRFFWGSVFKAAQKAFRRLGMAATRERNGILFFIVPGRRRFAVIGDSGIHEKVGQKFWEGLSAALAERFRARDFTGGLVEAIGEAGRQLAAHFPYDAATDVNELADDIDYGAEKK